MEFRLRRSLPAADSSRPVILRGGSVRPTDWDPPGFAALAGPCCAVKAEAAARFFVLRRKSGASILRRFGGRHQEWDHGADSHPGHASGFVQEEGVRESGDADAQRSA